MRERESWRWEIRRRFSISVTFFSKLFECKGVENQCGKKSDSLLNPGATVFVCNLLIKDDKLFPAHSNNSGGGMAFQIRLPVTQSATLVIPHHLFYNTIECSKNKICHAASRITVASRAKDPYPKNSVAQNAN